ncbi:MAG TPA: HD domain-containing phosphohydrolase, partial [Nitrospiraceae bacterium]|nr:HD domain-containing phosphohydrolase [Nitrospiraceae bacterium]
MTDITTSGQLPPATPPAEEPLLTHEKSLQGKIGQGSEARDILDQQILWLGSQCVTHLHALIKTARIHDRTNAALTQPVEAILTIIKTLGHDAPVVLRLQNDFLFLGEMHLKMTTQQLAVFSGVMDVLNGWRIGTISFSPSMESKDLREFAYLLATLDSDTSSIEDLMRLMNERQVRGIELEESKSVILRGSDRKKVAKILAKNSYAKAAGSVQDLVQKVREGRPPSFKQAKRAIQSVVDLMKYDESILLGLTTLRCHDQYTHNHSVNVSLLSIALGNRAGYPKKELADLGLAALFHDMGKASIPLEVLNKPGEFTEDDWRVMRSHPTDGVLSMIRLRGMTNMPGRMASAAFEHHMNYDFSGYPKLTVPWAQSLTGRILTIADCYDAMTSARVYRREPLAPEKVLKIMLAKSGQSFDPILLKLFVNCVGLIPIGSLVFLDTDELAVVLRPNTGEHAAQRPIVKIITDRTGNPLEGPEVDLTETDEEGQYR